MQIELGKARKLAEHIRDELRPYCLRIEIAGSIRRERPVVGDLDFVILPKAGNADPVRRRCIQSAKNVLVNGRQNFVCQLANGVQVDIFFARLSEAELFGGTPGNWGSLLVCRTGSKAFNIWLAAQAKRQGAHWDPYTGVWGSDGRLIPCEEKEEDVFNAIGLDYIRPTQREQ